MCERAELLVGYIYDEISSAERAEMEAHLSACASCRAEVAGLRQTRTHLTLWAPPEPDLGFRLIRGASEPAPALPRRRSFAPAFAFAAAAVIVLAVASAIANIEIRYDDAGLTVRTGWAAHQPAALEASANPQAAAPQPSPVRADSSLDARPVRAANMTEPGGSPAVDVAALMARLEQLERVVASRPDAVQHASADGRSDAAILRQVRQLVEESEGRQRVALAQGLMQVFNDFDRQRRADLAALQQGIGQYQGLTNAEMAHTRDIVNQFIRVAGKQEK